MSDDEETYEPEDCWWCGHQINTEAENHAHMHPKCFREAKADHDQDRRIDKELTDARNERVINK